MKTFLTATTIFFATAFAGFADVQDEKFCEGFNASIVFASDKSIAAGIQMLSKNPLDIPEIAEYHNDATMSETAQGTLIMVMFYVIATNNPDMLLIMSSNDAELAEVMGEVLKEDYDASMAFCAQ